MIIYYIRHNNLSSDGDLPADASQWLECQRAWWARQSGWSVTFNSDLCPVTLMCCWQVKVIGGDVKACRRTKRSMGLGGYFLCDFVLLAPYTTLSSMVYM